MERDEKADESSDTLIFLARLSTRYPAIKFIDDQHVEASLLGNLREQREREEGEREGEESPIDEESNSDLMEHRASS